MVVALENITFWQNDNLGEMNLRVVALPQVVGEVMLDVLRELLQEVGVQPQHLCQTRDVQHLIMNKLESCQIDVEIEEEEQFLWKPDTSRSQ